MQVPANWRRKLEAQASGNCRDSGTRVIYGDRFAGQKMKTAGDSAVFS
jgi:hypothetical protein